MILTPEQLYDVMLALHHGVSAAAWEGITDRPWWELSDGEKTSVLAAVRSAYEEEIRRTKPSPEAMRFNKLVLDRFDLASVQDEERQEQDARQKFLDIPSAKRGGASGIKQAINDLLSHSHYFSRAQELTVERRLAAKNLPTLDMLSAMLRKKHEKILKRGKIRTEEEYYLVQEILASLDFPIADEARQQLANLAYAYESRGK